MTQTTLWRIFLPLGLVFLWTAALPVSAQVSFGQLAGAGLDEEAVSADVEKENEGEKPKASKKSKTKKSKTKEGEASEATAESTPKGGPVLGRTKKQKFRIGLSLEARPNGECSNIFGSVPFPMDFPNQAVHLIEEEYPHGIRVDYRDLKEGGCRQMVLRMRTLKAGEKAEAAALVEVTRFEEAPPENPQGYHIPKMVPKEIKIYLKESPYIETEDRKIRKVSKEIFADDDTDWRKVENILKFVRDKVKYKEAYKEKEVRGAVAALETGEGDCEDMSALFIALCRIHGIPARTVRVPEHCWAEFYLEDESKNGFWFPAQVAGNEPLGRLTDLRPILQKGDAFNVPETPRETSRYVRELFTGNVKTSGQDPKFQFIREEVR